MSSPASRAPRKFLVVIDKTPECAVALRFAARRAQHTGGRVTLMCAATLPDFQQWRGVEEIMRDEAHAEAEGLLHDAAKIVNELGGILPELVIPYGLVTDCLAQLLKEDKDISILVLASGALPPLLDQLDVALKPVLAEVQQYRANQREAVAVEN